MPPKSQRSRACSQCRSRRVKCDETPGTCNQCRRLGLACSGPLVGSIVIDMTDRVVKPQNRKRKEATRTAMTIRKKMDEQHPPKIDSVAPESPPAQRSTAVDMPLAHPMFPTEQRYTEEVEKAMTAIRYYRKPPTFGQPTRMMSDALDTAFMSHYLELNKSYAPDIQWLTHLPRIHTNVKKTAVKLSLRATSMAFYGKLHKDPSILVDSWRWYTLGLSAQRQSISKLQKNAMPEEEEVLVPLILALYEIYVGATNSGSTSHLIAATEIMNMRGPDNCRSGAIWPLFRGIRSSSAHRSIVFNKPSLYASPEWMTLPFIDLKRDAHQSLADIELMIPHCTALLQIQGSLRVVFETPIPNHVDVTPCQQLAFQLMGDLDRWAATYPHLTLIARDPGPRLERKPTKLGSQNLGTPGKFVALIALNYNADLLTLNMVLYKTHIESASSLPSVGMIAAHCFEEATRCATAIMDAAAEIEQAQTPGFDLLRSIAPVMTVACTAPTWELRKAAKDMMQRWGAKIGGLTTMFRRI